MTSLSSPNDSSRRSLRAVIVDDEPLARKKLRAFCDRVDGLDVVAECGDGASALETLDTERPDLVFLDIQMPEMTGFEVLEALEGDPPPAVVFVTAYDEFALKAFDVHAIDYLLKPFDRDRFEEAIERARRQVAGAEDGADAAVENAAAEDAANDTTVEDADDDPEEPTGLRAQIAAMIADLRAESKSYPPRLVVKTSGRVVLVRVEAIDWIDAAGNYVKIHAGNETHLLRETMNGMEKRLDPDAFLRIHRSTIVRVDRIKELQQQFHGDYVVLLEGGQRLTLSRSYRERVQQLIEGSL